ncbi:PspC domain-containing protein [Wenjunlia tyrosinilytica]|uniref:Membrane protein n=1 Tax=Wenjunlia tyrosinilytica TaxID=1544741 RepID=A0A918DV67_9ACTN|nr:PspC domain-containing protein [Wenjunlia tyrosinilytica]GGO83460.1 membrane protein [Wenjunlia tyrosinilytica]
MTEDSAPNGAPHDAPEGPADARPDAGSAVAGVPLSRSRRHRVVGGVCGGLGRYFDLDPVIFRIVLGVLAVTGGIGLLLYGAAWLFIPAHGEHRNEAQRMLSGRVEGQGMAAVLTALVGSGYFLSTIGSDGGNPFPLLVIAAVFGAVFLSQRRRRGAESAAVPGGASATGVSDAPPAAQPPPTPGAPSWWKGAGSGHTGYLWGPDDGSFDETAGPRAPMPPPQPREPRSFLAFTVLCLAVCAAVIGTGATWSRPLGTALETGFACALAVLALGLLVGAWFGRARGGTIFLAVLTTFLLGVSAALPKNIGHDWRTVRWAPASAADVRSSYEIGAGQATLDLRRVDPKGATIRVHGEAGVGRLVVRVPDTVKVEVTAEIGAGVIELPGGESGDIDVEVDSRRRAVVEPTAPRRERIAGTFMLDLKVGAGHVEVIDEAA